MSRPIWFFVIFWILIILLFVTSTKDPCLCVAEEANFRLVSNDKLPSERADYFESHKNDLEYTRIGDTYFVLRTRMDYPGCSIFLMAIEDSPNAERQYTIKSVILTNSDGRILYENSQCDKKITPASPDNMYESSKTLVQIEESDDWFYKGNRLQITIEIETDSGITKKTYGLIVGTTMYNKYLGV